MHRRCSFFGVVSLHGFLGESDASVMEVFESTYLGMGRSHQWARMRSVSRPPGSSRFNWLGERWSDRCLYCVGRQRELARKLAHEPSFPSFILSIPYSSGRVLFQLGVQGDTLAALGQFSSAGLWFRRLNSPRAGTRRGCLEGQVCLISGAGGHVQNKSVSLLNLLARDAKREYY